MVMRLLMAAFVSVVPVSGKEPVALELPTENRHLFTGQPERFYMYVDRNFEGERSKPWQGGSFGFVRSPVRIGGEVVMTRFHEGIDIAPINRDKAGNPLDLVTSVSEGVVAHVNAVTWRSNYGKYLVVGHEWEGVDVYSLYAHLAEITVEPGDRVEAGFRARADGLHRERAEPDPRAPSLELGMLMSANYEGWHRESFGSTNYHGIFNGMNLSGVDVASFFLEHRENPGLRFSEFVLSRPAQFKVTVPAVEGEEPEFLRRHPWMRMKGVDDPVSWEIGFAATGHPISFTPGARAVGGAVLSHLRPSDLNQSFLTRGLVMGEGKDAVLSRRGRRLVALVTDDFPMVE